MGADKNAGTGSNFELIRRYAPKIALTIAYTVAVLLSSPYLILATMLDLITDGEYTRMLHKIWGSP